MTQAKVDLSSMKAGFAQLLGPARESLARSMAVAGGQVIRDEAKVRAPRGDTGALANAIYLAYKPGRSSDTHQVYSITWNAKKAPHGHLVELGYWQPFVVVKMPNGQYVTTNRRRPKPKWIPGKPFLGPALDGSASIAFSAIVSRGKVRFAELVAGRASLEET